MDVGDQAQLESWLLLIRTDTAVNMFISSRYNRGYCLSVAGTVVDMFISSRYNRGYCLSVADTVVDMFISSRYSRGYGYQ